MDPVATANPPSGPPIAARTAWGASRTLLLIALLLGARLATLDHPPKVHPDEDRFMRGIGFPAQ